MMAGFIKKSVNSTIDKLSLHEGLRWNWEGASNRSTTNPKYIVFGRSKEVQKNADSRKPETWKG